MSSGSYEDEVKPIKGDIFLDKLFGWLCLILTLVVLGVAVVRMTSPTGVAWLESTRIALILMAAAGCWLATLSTLKGFRWVILLFVVRIVGALAIYPWAGGPRYFGSEILFDLVVIWYGRLRIKTLSAERP